MKKTAFFPLLVLASLILSACGTSPTSTQQTVSQATSTLALTSTVAPSATSTSTQTPSFTPSVTPTGTATSTPSPTATATPTPIPTYKKLRGEVTINQAVCHYGPGAPYLYKYGVYKGSHLEILRRVEWGNYVEVQAIGGNNKCWVRADYFEFEGNWLDLEPVPAEQVKLPFSPYYPYPPTGVSASRTGSEVTISWDAYGLRPGDDSEQVPYVIESWVCQNGQMVFNPVGSWTTSTTIIDEPGCDYPSHARLYAAEKHGYTPWVNVPWPAAEGSPIYVTTPKP